MAAHCGQAGAALWVYGSSVVMTAHCGRAGESSVNDLICLPVLLALRQAGVPVVDQVDHELCRWVKLSRAVNS